MISHLIALKKKKNLGVLAGDGCPALQFVLEYHSGVVYQATNLASKENFGWQTSGQRVNLLLHVLNGSR